MIVRRQTELFYEWLENYLDYEQIKKKGDFSLETMRFLVDRFKHPERSFKSIHVAGSKGKGSVSAMIARIIEASGAKTGLYTSPHMLDFTERVSSATGPFDDATYGRACDIVVPLVDSIIPDTLPGGLEPTWFELVTLFAFVTFREAKLPWAVIETGLGGRLDATNVVLPEASVLTPIELEHTEYLGDTIEKIAREKAGIIKEGIPVFSAGQNSAARSVFERTAKEKGCPFFSMEDALRDIRSTTGEKGLAVEISFNELAGGPRFARAIKTTLKLPCAVQAENAALAAYVAKSLIPELEETTIERGLAEAWLPGRFEIVPSSPPVVLDGAHTVRSVSLSLDTFFSIYAGKAHLLFACAADKDVESIVELFAGRFDKVTLTRPGDRKASDIDRAEAAFTRIFRDAQAASLTVNPDWRTAIESSLSAAGRENAPLLIIGSFYLVTEAKRILASR
jgi:dihydrofolate synthase/folylpolyglutamate synthase